MTTSLDQVKEPPPHSDDAEVKFLCPHELFRFGIATLVHGVAGVGIEKSFMEYEEDAERKGRHKMRLHHAAEQLREALRAEGSYGVNHYDVYDEDKEHLQTLHLWMLAAFENWVRYTLEVPQHEVPILGSFEMDSRFIAGPISKQEQLMARLKDNDLLTRREQEAAMKNTQDGADKEPQP